MKPTITALMTTYNASHWVQSSVDSILSQTYENFELLVVDDGSTDNTVDVLEQYRDCRLRVISHTTNEGVGVRLDEALSLVNSPYIAKVDADDVNSPDRFQKQLQFIEETGFDIVKCHLSYFADNDFVFQSERFQRFKSVKEDEVNRVSTQVDIQKNLRHWPCFPHTTYFARSDIIKQFGYPHLRMFEDYVLFLRLLNSGCSFGCLDEKLVDMRISETSITTQLSEREIDEGLSAVASEKWPLFFPAMIEKAVFIFGAGQMAKSFGRFLLKSNIHFCSFVDWEFEGDKRLDILGESFPVITLKAFLRVNIAKTIVIAAQPARSDLVEFFKFNDMKEDEDFLILA